MKLPINIPLLPCFLADGYKMSHHGQYPDGTAMVYSNVTPRQARNRDDDFTVAFGIQATWLNVNQRFESFFSTPWDEQVEGIRSFSTGYLGYTPEGLIERYRWLHELGHLPIRCWALPEGTVIPHGHPHAVFCNVGPPEGFWVTNYLETIVSQYYWAMSTAATTAAQYRRVFDRYAAETSDAEFLSTWQGHDFSMRGLPGFEASQLIAAGHALSFQGSDTTAVMPWIRSHYPDVSPPDSYIGSVDATEHSVMSAGGQYNEAETILRILRNAGSQIVSVVSDTWDFWAVVTQILPRIKDDVIATGKKLVIRPDSSPKTPVEIICGDPAARPGSPEYKGLAVVLDEIFGSTLNSKGFRDLHPSIGMIYGDSITREYQLRILEGLKRLGYASTNIVLGIGSYTYQNVTRDTHGFAIKATAVRIDNEDIPIFKNPATGSFKRSHRGFLSVHRHADGTWQTVSHESMPEDLGALREVYSRGFIVQPEGFSDIRRRLAANLQEVM